MSFDTGPQVPGLRRMVVGEDALSSRGSPSTRTVDGHASPGEQQLRDALLVEQITNANERRASCPTSSH
jgi:hypothetical protein